MTVTRALSTILVLVHGVLGFNALRQWRRKIEPSNLIFERARWLLQRSKDEPSRKHVGFLVVQSTVQRPFVRPSELLVCWLAEVPIQGMKFRSLDKGLLGCKDRSFTVLSPRPDLGWRREPGGAKTSKVATFHSSLLTRYPK